MSKGSRRRPEDTQLYKDNYDRIFKREEREKESGLIELPEWTDALYPKESKDENEV